jgi:hypothetical protein
MERILTDYQQLVAAIQELPAPASGYVRVFRGQTRHHEKMLPSGLRRPRGVDDALFAMYANSLAADITHFSDQPEVIDDIELWLVWLKALAQHYGPGSRYLDVTMSIEVALWFALHEFGKVESIGVMGPAGRLDPLQDQVSSYTWCSYTRAQAPGFLYVFDVCKWDGKALPGHGMLVDLADAPGILARSKRMTAQQGCTLHALKGTDDPDLSNFFRCPPIRVGWPMTGFSLPSSVDRLFPLPANDDWYARFIGAPLVSHGDRRTRRLELAHPVAVNLYFPDRLEDVADIERRIITFAPTLLWPALIDSEEAVKPEFLAGTGDSPLFERATTIVLESPLCALTPPVEGNDWNHGLLAGNAAQQVAASEFGSSGASHGVSLTNVFVEFSPLEKTGWERVETGDWSIVWQRGLWVLREGRNYEVRAWFQTFTGSDSVLAGTEPLLVTLDPSTNRFHCRTAKTGDWQDLVQVQPKVAKAFFAALSVMGEVTPWMKPAPFVRRIEHYEDGRSVMFAGVRGAAAKLERVRDRRSGRGVYLLRDITSGDVFAEPSVPMGHYLEEGNSWAAVDAGVVREKMADEALRQVNKATNEKRYEDAIGGYDWVIRDFESFDRARASVATARYNKGAVLAHLDRHAEAIVEYDKVVAAAEILQSTLQELGARALFSKAFSLEALGRSEEADEAARTLLALFGHLTAPEIQPLLTQARQALGEIERGIE